MRKVVKLLTATMLLLSIFISSNNRVMASTLEEDQNQVSVESNLITAQSLWRTYLGAVYEITGKVSNKLYDVPAKSVSITGAVGTTTGSRKYTNNEAWAETTVSFKNYYDSIYAFGRTDVANSWTKKIGIAIYRNSNWTRVASGNVGHDKGITASRMSTGNYTVVYNIHDPIKWNLGVFYFFNRAPCTQCLPANVTQPLTLTEQQTNTPYHFENDTAYILPQQKEFKKSNNEAKLKSKKSILTINDLMEEHFDADLQDYVHSLKNFNVGDSIIVSDTIKDIYYDVEQQTTSLGFEYTDKANSNEKSKIYWEFSGDLQNQFLIGDSVSFKIKVISINNDLNLETLDILGYQAEVAPKIDSFLLKHLKNK